MLRQAGGGRAVGRVVRYILGVSATEPGRVRALLEGAFGREGREAYMTGADVLRAEGRVEGRVEGQARVLIRLLTRRFGKLDAALVQRLESASSEELDLITDRVITAPTLADVFSERGDKPTG
jgi:hypothetical protein